MWQYMQGMEDLQSQKQEIAEQGQEQALLLLQHRRKLMNQYQREWQLMWLWLRQWRSGGRWKQSLPQRRDVGL
jgi:hypothetical protein